METNKPSEETTATEWKLLMIGVIIALIFIISTADFSTICRHLIDALFTSVS